ncbi:phenylacetyl-ligase [Lichtheimia corymbifera JMRC:FSU:9682]|uniref:Phenylacetyl-ligase n=1 Tax=Lichtheimia corymbifera JMRC:FSU:9682 TaxID=1263082 RepID=A0A068RRG3_9FUNG|nr:phenylacetyl-ligase [Lichtheimia corymbifera JMRC:FSU:9682]
MLVDAVTNECLTYGDLRQRILQFAAGLQDQCDFKKGDTLLLCSPNDYEYPIPLLGAAAAGGASSPANPNYTVHEILHQLTLTKAKVIIGHPDNIDRVLAAASQAGVPQPHIFVLGSHEIKGCQSFRVLLGKRRGEITKLTAEESKTTPAYLCFSSGTTGQSKGVITTHANISVNILQYLAIDGKVINSKKDSTIIMLPMFHIMTLSNILHTSIYTGTTLYVLKRYELERVCALIESKRVPFAYMVPPVLLQIAKDPVAQKYDLSSLKWINSAAAPLGTELVELLKKRLPTTIVKQAYGSTETSPVATTEPIDDVAQGSVGLLAPNMECKIVNEDGKALGTGERGEIWLKGPNIMMGYINNPEATRNSIDEDGFYHTGDVGVIDRQGHMWIVDRIKELIKYKGFQVAPVELESILVESPDVADCGVIGMYDEAIASEIPIAYVKLMPNVPSTEETKQRIKQYLADRVVPYKKIHHVVFTEAIPRSAAGKILRRILKEQLLNDVKDRRMVSSKSKL